MAGAKLDPEAWEGRCVNTEPTLHQLSPFLGKMKSTMANELIRVFSKPDDVILDPFSGSGTVPLEASSMGRHAYGIDRNPYAVILTRGKLNPPRSLDDAIDKAECYLDQIEPEKEAETETIPEWVSKFFHPKTLSGLSQLFPLLLEKNENFLLACLLGILHHQRPGFLSHPASHLRPYLRDEKFPREQNPEMYEYREIAPRLISKIERAYRRFPKFHSELARQAYAGNSPDVMKKDFDENSVDAIITSPPYMDKLDYGRDNRLRLFFIGVEDYTGLEDSPKTREEYRAFLDDFVTEATSVLKPEGHLVFVLGEAKRSGSVVDTSEVLVNIVEKKRPKLTINRIVSDKVPVREINSMSSNEERIIALEKSN